MVRSINPDFQVHASPESPKLPLTRSMSTSSVGQCSEDLDVPSMATLDLAILDNKDEDKLAQDAFLSVPCLNFPSLFFQFSLDNCCKLQVNLASLLEGPGGFLEAAQDNAWAAAIVPSKPQNLEKVSKKPRVGPKNGSLSCCEGKPWWKVYDKSLEHSPLEMWWDTDEKKKIKMDGKNFASRCYHRVDAVSRSLAQSAHQDALKFAALKIGTVEPSSKRSKTKKGLKQ